VSHTTNHFVVFYNNKQNEFPSLDLIDIFCKNIENSISIAEKIYAKGIDISDLMINIDDKSIERRVMSLLNKILYENNYPITREDIMQYLGYKNESNFRYLLTRLKSRYSPIEEVDYYSIRFSEFIKLWNGEDSDKRDKYIHIFFEELRDLLRDNQYVMFDDVNRTIIRFNVEKTQIKSEKGSSTSKIYRFNIISLTNMMLITNSSESIFYHKVLTRAYQQLSQIVSKLRGELGTSICENSTHDIAIEIKKVYDRKLDDLRMYYENMITDIRSEYEKKIEILKMK